MSLKIGPFTGVSESEARIWFKAEADADFTVEVRNADANFTKTVRTSGDGIGMATFSGLAAGTRYAYNIADGKGEDLLKDLSQAGFHTFPAPEDDAELSFAFFSCHKPFTKRGKPDTSALQMWEKLGGLLRNRDRMALRFLLALGDQVYADELWKGKKCRGRAHEEIVACYKDLYQKFLKFREVREVTSRCPVFMIWDDHEVRDGWGSKRDDNPESSMYKAAREVYERYQLMHNPHVDPAKGYYAFRYGKTGFVVLDLRRYRSARQKILLGEEQKKWLQDWLGSEGRKCRVVFIACSVPFLHLTSHISQSGRKFLSLSWLILHISGLKDDLVDQWTSQEYVRDAKFFAELLYGLANEEAIRFVLLGGDVHVGTFAVLRSSRDSDEFHPLIYQFTSSPISNKPAYLTKRLLDIAPEIKMGDDIPFRGRLLKIFPKRNFGVVEVRRHPKTGDYDVTFEIHCEGSETHRFPTVW